MTLTDILVSSLIQMGLDYDAQTLDMKRDEYTVYANDAVRDLGETLKLRKTDKAQIVNGHIRLSDLSERCVKVVKVDDDKFFQAADSQHIRVLAEDGEAEITYLYQPKGMSSPSDVPNIPEFAHHLIPLYVVGRARAAGDVSTQRGGNIFMQMYLDGRANLKRNYGEPDTYRINYGWTR